MGADESTDQIGIPAVTDECLRRWAEQSGLDRVALEQCLADPEREVVDRPPRWTGLSSSGSRFLLAGGGEACFALTPSEIPGHEYQAITCAVRNRSLLARELPPPAYGRHWPIGIALIVLLVLVAIGAGVYALANSGDGGSGHKANPPTTARALIAARFGGERDPALRGLKLGRPRAVHHSRGRLPREVCAPLRARSGRAVGRYCVEIAGTTVVSRWVVPRGRPDRDRFRVLCSGTARSQGRCSTQPLR